MKGLQEHFSSFAQLSGLERQRSDCADYVRSEQIRAILRFTPVMMAANAVNAIISTIVVLPTANNLLVAVWLSMIGVVAGFATWSWAKGRTLPRPGSASPRAIRRATLHASILGVLWGILPALWFAGLSSDAQLLLGTLVTGMICCGGFALATVPSAGLAYVCLLTAGSLIGVIRADTEYRVAIVILLCAYATAICYALLGTARLYVDKVASEAELAERGEVIELLLNEFQESASDWLFELDTELRVRQGSPRFADLTGLDDSALRGRTFADFLAAHSRDAFFGEFRKGASFRDLLIEVFLPDGSNRWWSVSATPIALNRSSVAGWRCVGSDVTDAKVAEDRVLWLATTDALTELPNRTSFRSQVSAALSSMATQMAIAVLDLDEFKSVNDSLGHSAGDELLTRVAARLKEFCGPRVEISRLGGDEFGLLFRDADPKQVLERLEAICRALSEPLRLRSASVSVGATAGVAFRTDRHENMDRLMNEADTALYVAKQTKKGSIATFSAEMERELNERRQCAEDLQRALKSNEFSLSFQPIVDIASSRVVSFEALIRWHHPTRGMVPPDMFIGIAETVGLISQIGRWVLETATREAMSWPADIGVSVNVSPSQLGEDGLDEMVIHALRESGLSPHRLELELTEAVFIRHGQRAETFIANMNSIGVGVALDDFGTGYSSLGYLTRFPVQKLKIDRSFVSGDKALRERNAVISAIVSMARALSMKTTAEGIENEAELAWVRGLGCNLAQGYHFARPLKQWEVADFLAAQQPGALAGAIS